MRTSQPWIEPFRAAPKRISWCFGSPLASSGFDSTKFGEILRPPTLAYMPLAPRSLLGLANLRGTVLPVVNARRLLNFEDAPVDDNTRVIVVDCGAPVGFVVDRIDRLLTLPASRIDKDDAGSGSVDPDLLEGVVKGAEGESTTKILNPRRLLRDEFTQLGVSGRRSAALASVSAAMSGPITEEPRQHVSLVSFDLCRQEYALPLDRVQEIIQLPEQVSDFARSETAVRELSHCGTGCCRWCRCVRCWGCQMTLIVRNAAGSWCCRLAAAVSA